MRSDRTRAIFFTAIGAVLGAVRQYLLTVDQQRVELVFDMGRIVEEKARRRLIARRADRHELRCHLRAPLLRRLTHKPLAV